MVSPHKLFVILKCNMIIPFYVYDTPVDTAEKNKGQKNRLVQALAYPD